MAPPLQPGILPHRVVCTAKIYPALSLVPPLKEQRKHPFLGRERTGNKSSLDVSLPSLEHNPWFNYELVVFFFFFLTCQPVCCICQHKNKENGKMRRNVVQFSKEQITCVIG